MSDYFMGQIMMTGFPFAQRGFAQCNGALLAIRQNSALFSLLGIAYGGDGQATFALPDLRSRTPTGGGFSSADGGWQPPTMPLGAIGGVETVTLMPDQIPRHSHGLAATSDQATTSFLEGNELLAQTTNGATLYGAPSNLVPLGGGPSSMTGSGAPHPNMQPYSVINFNIALSGIFPSRS
ncbi:phage tail protein [Sphingomonas ginsenosidivorax]|uniref:Phage tail protein n=1 Tax=Sphingomonas ginsenosidivorax TaxID=862135 RepID=A0A5C6UMX9_9SPHN|nr:tail fiber protein [Sphingomonas ginsenosidivorax]TXC72645.1 phage tail protein [Sphingomonas ginsenosidivorax]